MQCVKSLLMIKSTQSIVRCWWWRWGPAAPPQMWDGAQPLNWPGMAVTFSVHILRNLKLFSSIPHPHSKHIVLHFWEKSFSCCWFTCRQQREYFSISLTTFSIIWEFNYIFLHPDPSVSHLPSPEYLLVDTDFLDQITSTRFFLNYFLSLSRSFLVL